LGGEAGKALVATIVAAASAASAIVLAALAQVADYYIIGAAALTALAVATPTYIVVSRLYRGGSCRDLEELRRVAMEVSSKCSWLTNARSSALEQAAEALEQAKEALEDARSGVSQAVEALNRAASSVGDAASKLAAEAGAAVEAVKSAASDLKERAASIDGTLSRLAGAAAKLEGAASSLPSRAAECVLAPVIVAEAGARERIASALVSAGVIDESTCRLVVDTLLGAAEALLQEPTRVRAALAAVDAHSALALASEVKCPEQADRARAVLARACGVLGCGPEAVDSGQALREAAARLGASCEGEDGEGEGEPVNGPGRRGRDE